MPSVTSAHSLPSARRWPDLWSLAGGWILLAIGLWRFRTWNLDDTYITLRYVNHWLEKGEPFYNLGDPVLGYTHYFWFFLLALNQALDLPMWLMPKLVSMAAAFGLVFSCWWWERRLSNSPVPLSPLWLGAYTPVALWGAIPMETMLFVLLLFTLGLQAALGTFKGRAGCWIWSLALFFLMTSRPEGLAAGLVLLGLLWMRRRGYSLEMGRFSWRPIATLLVTVTLFYLWFQSQYGTIVPNTFAAKSGPFLSHLRRGLADYWHHFQDFALLWIAGALWIALGLWGWRKVRSDFAFAIVMGFLALTQIANGLFMLYTGSDWMPGYRFILPQMPFLFLAMGLLHRFLRRGLRLGLGVAVLAGSLSLLPKAWTWGHPIPAEAEALGRYLDTHASMKDTLAIWDAGVIPFYARMSTLDLGGLNAPTVAQSFPKSYHFNRYDSATAARMVDSLCNWKPRYIVLKEQAGEIADEGPGKSLSASPCFWSRYRRVHPPGKSPYGVYERL